MAAQFHLAALVESSGVAAIGHGVASTLAQYLHRRRAGGAGIIDDGGGDGSEETAVHEDDTAAAAAVAFRLYRAGASLGHAEAMHAVAIAYHQVTARDAISMYSSFDFEHHLVQGTLARCSSNGLHFCDGSTSNHSLSFVVLIKTQHRSVNPRASAQGLGVAADSASAVFWLSHAAVGKSHAPSAETLGLMFETGEAPLPAGGGRRTRSGAGEGSEGSERGDGEDHEAEMALSLSQAAEAGRWCVTHKLTLK